MITSLYVQFLDSNDICSQALGLSQFLLCSSDCLDHQVSPPKYLLDGLKEMVFMLRSWITSREVGVCVCVCVCVCLCVCVCVLTTPSCFLQNLKFHRSEIPEDIKPARLLEQLARAITKCEVRENDYMRILLDV